MIEELWRCKSCGYEETRHTDKPNDEHNGNRSGGRGIPPFIFSHRRAADMAARQAAVSEAAHSEAEVAAAVFDFQSPRYSNAHASSNPQTLIH